jgi:hypothetical protein
VQRRTAAIMSLGATVLVLAGLYVAFQRSPERGAAEIDTKRDAGSSPAPAAAVAPAQPPSAPPPLASAAPAQVPPLPTPFRIAVEDVKPGVVIPAVRAKQGDAVSIIVTTNRAGTLEIHGYGQKVTVTPGAEAKLVFRAERTGRFPIELHARDGGHVEVTALEVQPK